MASSTRSSPTRRQDLTILSANIRGFRTNVGDLSHNFINKHKADIVVTVETFLDDKVSPTFARIPGYSHWYRRDRQSRKKGKTKGGVAVCHKENMEIQALTVQVPTWMEIMFFRIMLSNGKALLLCAMYRPQWHLNDPITFLTENLDTIMESHNCQNVIIVGDLNPPLVQRAFNDMMAVQGLTNHVNFPTHELGGSLDPVLTDLPDSDVECKPLDKVGTSDHYAVMTNVKLRAALDEGTERMTWIWKHADWEAIQRKLEQTVWDDMFTGKVNEDAAILTSYILSLQHDHVPHRVYTTKPGDPPWFGYRCRLAADTKHKAWVRLKRHPTTRNRNLHKQACKDMKRTSKWAIATWKRDLRSKLSGNSIGSKEWWTLVKEQQGHITHSRIPALNKADGTLARTSQEKAEVFAHQFSQKMTVPDPNRATPSLSRQSTERLENIDINEDEVRRLLKAVNTKKATGPDEISPHVLKKCARELANPLMRIFRACIQTQTWPDIWKTARVTPVHKKKEKGNPKNYRPVSLLSVVSKIFEKIIAKQLTEHLDQHHLLSNRQFGFRKNRSTADLLTLLAKEWNDTLDAGKNTVVVALDIAGAFDCVWHQGLLVKLAALGVSGNLLDLLSSYLTGRTIQVVVNGKSSSNHDVGASVPQGSVLGPILWNVFFNDLLQALPSSSAYADDCTLSYSYEKKDVDGVVARVNNHLDRIAAWGERWQVKFAAEKTQCMVISRSPNDSQRIQGRLLFNGGTLDTDDYINILGVEFDSSLTFTRHVDNLARKASSKISVLRRMKQLLDKKGLSMLYKAQVRSHLEYGFLAWMSCPRSHLDLLDKVQRRAERMIASIGAHEEQPSLDSLAHRRRVGALTVLHKAQVQQVPHLAGLRIPWRQPTRSTRSALSSDCQVEVPRSRSVTHQRTFVSVISRLWNDMAESVELQTLNTERMKHAANTWCKRQVQPAQQESRSFFVWLP